MCHIVHPIETSGGKPVYRAEEPADRSKTPSSHTPGLTTHRSITNATEDCRVSLRAFPFSPHTPLISPAALYFALFTLRNPPHVLRDPPATRPIARDVLPSPTTIATIATTEATHDPKPARHSLDPAPPTTTPAPPARRTDTRPPARNPSPTTRHQPPALRRQHTPASPTHTRHDFHQERSLPPSGRPARLTVLLRSTLAGHGPPSLVSLLLPPWERPRPRLLPASPEAATFGTAPRAGNPVRLRGGPLRLPSFGLLASCQKAGHQDTALSLRSVCRSFRAQLFFARCPLLHSVPHAKKRQPRTFAAYVPHGRPGGPPRYPGRPAAGQPQAAGLGVPRGHPCPPAAPAAASMPPPSRRPLSGRFPLPNVAPRQAPAPPPKPASCPTGTPALRAGHAAAAARRESFPQTAAQFEESSRPESRERGARCARSVLSPSCCAA